jgi:hypothetical protein
MFGLDKVTPFVNSVLKPKVRSVVAGKASQRLLKVSNSRAFRTLISGPIAENIAECTGEIIGSALFRGASLLPASVRFGLGAAAVAGAYLYSKNGDPEDVNNAMILGAAGAGVLVLPNFGLEIAGGVVGGFAGVKVAGSEEKLIDPQDLLRSYAFKSLTSKAANEVVGGVISNSKVLINFAQEQVVGCLAFNALDIKETVQKVEEGTVLDGILPAKIELKTTCSLERWADSFTHLFTHEMTEALESLSNLTVDVKKEVIAQSVNLLKDKVLINANKYIKFINNNPELKNLLKGIHSEMIKSEKNEAELTRLINEFKSKLSEVSPQIKEVQEALTKMIAEMGSSVVINQISPDVRVQTLLHFLKAENIKLEGSQLRDMAKVGLDYLTARTSSKCAEWIKDQEEKVIGFNITSDTQREVLLNTMQIHLAPILLLAFNDVLTMKQEELDIREVYTNLNSLFWSYYQPSLGNTISAIFEGIIANQIKGAALRNDV